MRGGKHEEERPGSRDTERVKIKIYLKQIGCESVDWIQMSQGKVQWRVL
jgi:hypothetical protein